MQHTRKLLALILALVMVMALATTAFATSTAGTATITVKNALKDGTYNAYKIFDVTTSGTGSDATYAYTIDSSNNPWFNTVQSFANDTNNGLNLTQIGTSNVYNVTFDNTAFNDTKAAALAAELNKVTNKPSNPDSTATGTEGQDGVTAKFNNLKNGYYFITSPIGSTCILDTTTGTKVVNEKNGLPNLTKKVNKADTSTAEKDWADCNDVDFGRTVEFKIEILVDNTSDDYVLTDTLPTGFSLDDTSVTVGYAEKASGAADNYKDSKTVQATNGTSTNYELKTTPDSTKNEEWAFQITFKGDYLATLKPADKLIVTYSATVGTGATVGDKGNTNTAKLTYGSNRELTDTTKTYIWSFDVFKFVNNKNNTEAGLAGAKFTLSKNVNGTSPISFSAVSGETLPTYKVDNSNSATTEITTGNTGKFTLQGLDSDTYYLTETAAPDGYNKLEGPIKIEIKATQDTTKLTSEIKYWNYTVPSNGNNYYSGDGQEISPTNPNIKVENKTGSLLPSTGGIGTTIFYVLGGILVVGAGVLLVTKKRMNNAK